MKVVKFFKKYKVLLALCLIALISRVFYLHESIIPFNFDHGKDHLAVMDLILNKNLKFIGPWTSIPGLHFGPGWYYLIAPGLFLSQFHPLGSSSVMVVLLLIQVCLAYFFFNSFAALIVATSPFWLMLSKSAWNPFPMTLISWILLILLQKYKRQKFLTKSESFVIGFTISLGFHFSAAFSIFYPVIIILLILKNRLKVEIKNLILISVGFISAFLPQILFELKNNFSQTTAVINYFFNGQSDPITTDKVLVVTKSYLKSLQLFFFPDTLNKIYYIIVACFFFVLIITYFLRNDKKSSNKTSLDSLDLIIFVSLPLIGFIFLHYNVWYNFAIAPILVLLISKIVERSRNFVKIFFISLYLISPLISYYKFSTVDRPIFITSKNFFLTKKNVVEHIYQNSNNESFASFHYVPDIYDYTYQYIYFWKAMNGATLPIEFSYKPGETNYIPEKSSLLKHFNQYSENPKKIFYVVESPENSEFLDAWWNAQKFSKIVHETKISNEITVYEAVP